MKRKPKKTRLSLLEFIEYGISCETDRARRYLKDDMQDPGVASGFYMARGARWALEHAIEHVTEEEFYALETAFTDPAKPNDALKKAWRAFHKMQEQQAEGEK